MHLVFNSAQVSRVSLSLIEGFIFLSGNVSQPDQLQIICLQFPRVYTFSSNCNWKTQSVTIPNCRKITPEREVKRLDGNVSSALCLICAICVLGHIVLVLCLYFTILDVYQAVLPQRQSCFASVTFKLQQRELCLLPTICIQRILYINSAALGATKQFCLLQNNRILRRTNCLVSCRKRRDCNWHVNNHQI